jgi:phosphate/phosphite/phosphonate ABC transporter binding protein
MLRWYALPLASLLILAPVARADDKPLIFGLQRTVSDAKAEGQVAALEGYMTEALKRPVKAQVFQSYDTLGDALAKGAVDIAWINPVPYVRATIAQPGIQPIAKAIRHGATYQSVVFVKASSPAKALLDLKGLKAAWVDKESSSGYLYPRAMFIRAGVSPATFFSGETFYGDAQAVCQAVLSGEAGFGATFMTGSENTDLRADGCTTALGDAAKDKFRALAASDAIPNEVIAVRSGFDSDLGASLGAVFGQMSQTEAGQKVLTEVFNAEGFGATLDTDFNTVLAVLKTVGALQPAAPAPATDTTTTASDTKKKPKKKAKTPAPSDQ